jgi:hypothetical protein
VDWTNNLGLTLNRTKTKAIIVGTSRYINAIDYNITPRILVDGVVIDFSDNVNYLGVTISSNLSWAPEACRRSKKIFGAMHQLKLAKQILPQDLRKQLVVSLIFPLLDYCCVALLDIIKESDLLIQRALNSCVRFIFNSNRYEHITPYFEELQWLKVRERRQYFVGCLLFSIFTSKIPDYLSSQISF